MHLIPTSKLGYLSFNIGYKDNVFWVHFYQSHQNTNKTTR